MAKTRIKCPWCGKVVGYSRSNRLEPHFQSTKVKCHGVGQPRDQVEQLRATMDKRAESRRR